jgi:hypothetical protein
MLPRGLHWLCLPLPNQQLIGYRPRALPDGKHCDRNVALLVLEMRNIDAVESAVGARVSDRRNFVAYLSFLPSERSKNISVQWANPCGSSALNAHYGIFGQPLMKISAFHNDSAISVWPHIHGGRWR